MNIDNQKEILAHMLERAQHYNNAMIAGGYAAFFAAWSFFRQQYQNDWYDVSLLIMLLSVMIFVLWNVLANILMGNDLFRKAELMGRHLHDPIYLTEALASFDRDAIDRVMRRRTWWRIMLFSSIIPGITAALIWFYVVGSGILGRLMPTIQGSFLSRLT